MIYLMYLYTHLRGLVKTFALTQARVFNTQEQSEPEQPLHFFLHTRKENNPGWRLTCPNSQPFQGKFQNWRCIQLLESSTCPKPWFCEPTDIRKTRTRHSSRPLDMLMVSSWQFCLWLSKMMCDHELCPPKNDGKFIVISSASIHIAPGKEAVIYRRNDLKESPFVGWKTHQPLEKGHAEFGTKDQRMKIRPVSVNALVLRLLMGTSNGYFELVVFNSLDVTHQKKTSENTVRFFFPGKRRITTCPCILSIDAVYCVHHCGKQDANKHNKNTPARLSHSQHQRFG